MTSSAAAERPPSRPARLQAELRKLPAFVRRDILIAWSYRFVFVSDILSLVLQVVLFGIVGLMVDPQKLPTFDGTRPTYLEFVAAGIAVGAFIQLALTRVSAVIREEQVQGTLESLLMTPTSLATIQLGSVVYDLIYIPARTVIFLVAAAVALDLDFERSGMVPAAAILLVFIPFVWGLGLIAGAATLTYRRGTGPIGFGVTALFLASGAFFPLELLPGWLPGLAELNPIAIAVDGIRQAVLGGAGLDDAVYAVVVLVPFSVVSLTIGTCAFRAALARERRRGTLALY